MTENYGLSGLVLYSQFILNELACYTCPPIIPGPVHCNTNSVTQLVVRSCSSTTGDIGGSFVFWSEHCAVHAYLPVVLFCSVLK